MSGIAGISEVVEVCGGVWWWWWCWGGLKCLSSVLVDSKKERKMRECAVQDNICRKVGHLQIRENGVGCFVKWREIVAVWRAPTVENAPLVCFRLERNTWGLSA